MKLYFSPGACSLSPHIVLREAGYDFDLERVNNQEKKTASGLDYWGINGKGQVPVLELDTPAFRTSHVASGREARSRRSSSRASVRSSAVATAATIESPTRAMRFTPGGFSKARSGPRSPSRPAAPGRDGWGRGAVPGARPPCTEHEN